MIDLPKPHKITPCPCRFGPSAPVHGLRQTCHDFFVDAVYPGHQGSGVDIDTANRLAQLTRMEVVLRNLHHMEDMEDFSDWADLMKQVDAIIASLPEQPKDGLLT